MTAPDSADTELRRKSPSGDIEVVIALLGDLYKRKTEGNTKGITVHMLCSIEGIPTQRDQRVKELIENLCERRPPLIERVSLEVTGGERVGYRITDEGVRYWNLHGLALSGLRNIRRKTA